MPHPPQLLPLDDNDITSRFVPLALLDFTALALPDLTPLTQGVEEFGVEEFEEFEEFGVEEFEEFDAEETARRWAELMTPEVYNSIHESTRKFLRDRPHLGFDPFEAEDITQEVLVQLLSGVCPHERGRASAAQTAKWWGLLKTYRYLRNNGTNPIMRAKGARVHTNDQGTCLESVEMPELSFRGDVLMELSVAQEEVRQVCWDNVWAAKKTPQSKLRYTRITELLLDGWTNPELAEFEGVSRNRMATITQEIRDALRASHPDDLDALNDLRQFLEEVPEDYSTNRWVRPRDVDQYKLTRSRKQVG